MSYDGIVMRAVTLELNENLQGARIDKIFQPSKNELYLNLRQTGHTYRLLLSVLAQEAGVYLTSRPSINPTTPPHFCMLLRKHLEGGRITNVCQNSLERIIEITCDVINDWGEPAQRKLIIEIMGKHSNIILLDPATDRIIDAIHRISPSISRYRQVLPGLSYQTPPPQEKLIPWEVEQEVFYDKLLSYSLSQTLYKAILSSFIGLGPQTVEEIIYRSGLSSSLSIEYCGEYELNKLWLAFNQFAKAIKGGDFSPEIVFLDKKPLTFSALALTHYSSHFRQSFPSMNEAVDKYYNFKKETNQFQQKKNDLNQVIKKETERCEKKAGLQLNTISEAKNSDHYRLWGELLTANLYALKPGKEAQVNNFYTEEGQTEIIPLEEHLTVLENAQRYFNKYRKAKNAAQKAQPQYEETLAELNYLFSLATSLENVDILSEIEEIKDELREAGYIKTIISKKSKVKPSTPEATIPLKLLLDGWDIYVGRNNKQNDQLVTRISKPEDLWLHTKDIPGSHVIIKSQGNTSIPENILEKAALLAAYHSKARSSANVPVDYTLRKYVWKIKGAKPGMVHYESQRTIYVTPNKVIIDSLLESI
ncbi:MAG: fibronectin/fibrinogen-binding protein [Firmicutes bacterium HGW-Firmicutes-12]|nr:MAG: fibronectin/fibrinogen-binding protein [Firmicutes bacterium HGW-Firmicutes-12]